MSNHNQQPVTLPREAGAAPPIWWVVFWRELSDLWIGGKALWLILVYSLLLGIWSYVLASNSELSLIPPKEMVFEMLKAFLEVSLFVALIIGADSIAGERERATLEGLLLTPTSRRQLVAGKFLAAISPWPVALAMTIPYWNLLAQGDEVFGQAILWGAILAAILTPALAAIGMLVSLWAKSNRTSMFLSLGLYLLLLLPSQLPGKAQTGAIGSLLQLINPLAAANHFPAKILVNNRTLEEMWPWLVSPVVLAVLSVGLLFLFARGLRLETTLPGWIRSSWRRVRGVGVVGLVVATMISAAPAIAQSTVAVAPPDADEQPEESVPKDQSEETAPIEQSELTVDIDLDTTTVKAGDKVLYKTVVTNRGSGPTIPLVVAMNIINLEAKGEIVDPEDWSPQRTQHLPPLAPNESTTLSWQVNTILDGDYMIYMVAIPVPEDTDATSQPVVSSGIHLTVTPHTKINPGGVLPYAIGGPVLLLLVIMIVYWRRNRAVDSGAGG